MRALAFVSLLAVGYGCAAIVGADFDVFPREASPATGGGGTAGAGGRSSPERCQAVRLERLTGGDVELEAVAPADDGAFVVAGRFRGEIQYGGAGGEADGFLARFGTTGMPWFDQFGNATEDQSVADVAVDRTSPVPLYAIVGKLKGTVGFGAGGGHATGMSDWGFYATYQNDAFLRSDVPFSAEEFEPEGVAFFDEHVVIAAHFKGTVTLDSGTATSGASGMKDGVVILRYDLSGMLTGSLAITSENESVGVTDVAVDAFGNVVVTGDVEEAASFGGLSGPDVGDAGYVLFYEWEGDRPTWVRLLTQSGGEGPMGIPAPDVNGVGIATDDVVVTGEFEGTLTQINAEVPDDSAELPTGDDQKTAYVVALHRLSGKVRDAWAITEAGEDTSGTAVAIDADHNFAVVGRIGMGMGTASFLRLFDADGNEVCSVIWNEDVMGDEVDVTDVAFTTTGEAVVVGHFRGTIDFGLEDPPKAEDRDGFAALYALP